MERQLEVDFKQIASSEVTPLPPEHLLIRIGVRFGRTSDTGEVFCAHPTSGENEPLPLSKCENIEKGEPS